MSPTVSTGAAFWQAQPPLPSLLAAAVRTATAEADIRPFRANVAEAELGDLRRRIAATRWPDRETVNDQSQGVQLARLQEHALLGNGLRLAQGRGQAQCSTSIPDDDRSIW